MAALDIDHAPAPGAPAPSPQPVVTHRSDRKRSEHRWTGHPHTHPDCAGRGTSRVRARPPARDPGSAALIASASRADPDRSSPADSTASGGSCRSGFPGPHKFLSAEGILFPDDPDLGLREHSPCEGIATPGACRKLLRRVDRWIHLAAQSLAELLYGLKELRVSRVIAHDHDIDVAARGILSLRHRSVRKCGANSRRKGRQRSLEWLRQAHRLSRNWAQLAEDRRVRICLVVLLVPDDSHRDQFTLRQSRKLPLDGA